MCILETKPKKFCRTQFVVFEDVVETGLICEADQMGCQNVTFFTKDNCFQGKSRSILTKQIIVFYTTE
jgi:hypothetical protein